MTLKQALLEQLVTLHVPCTKRVLQGQRLAHLVLKVQLLQGAVLL